MAHGFPLVERYPKSQHLYPVDHLCHRLCGKTRSLLECLTPGCHQRVICIARHIVALRKISPQHSVISNILQELAEHRPLWDTARHLSPQQPALSPWIWNVPLEQVSPGYLIEVGRHFMVFQRLRNTNPR